MTQEVKEAANAASSLPPSSPMERNGSTVRRRARLSPRLTASLCLLAIAIAGMRLVMLSPWYQERRLSRLPLPELLKEVRDGRNKPALLYYAGLRLIEQNRCAEADVLLER